MMALLARTPFFTFPDYSAWAPRPSHALYYIVLIPIYLTYVDITWIDNICISRANYLRNIGIVYTFETKVISQKLPESYNLEQLEMIKPSKPNKLIVGGAASSLLAVVALQ